MLRFEYKIKITWPKIWYFRLSQLECFRLYVKNKVDSYVNMIYRDRFFVKTTLETEVSFLDVSF